MSHLPAPDFTVLIEYITGVASPDEAAQIDQWVAASPKHQRRLEAAQRLVRAVRERKSTARETAVSAIERSFVAHMAQADPAVKVGRARLRAQDIAAAPTALRRGAGLRKIVWSAGALIGAVVLVLIAQQGKATNREITRTYTTSAGQQGVVTLDDGTTVLMSPETKLRLVDARHQQRRVLLDGEAFFSVAPSNTRPFVVQTRDVTTRVLGTTFLVRNPRGGPRTHVAVASGKVSVRVRDRAPVTLTSGYIADISGAATTVQSIDSARSDGDMSDVLSFNNTPLVDVLALLNRWYGYEFRYQDSTFVRQRVTMNISTKSSFEALETVHELLDVTLTVKGDTIVLTPNQLGNKRKSSYDKNYRVFTPLREVGR